MIAAGVIGGIFLICTVVMFLGVKEKDGESLGPNLIDRQQVTIKVCAYELKLSRGVWEHCADPPVFALRILLTAIKLALVHAQWTCVCLSVCVCVCTFTAYSCFTIIPLRK